MFSHSPGEVGHRLNTRDFQFVQSLIKRLAGIHLSDNKKPIVEVRLAKRIRALGLSTFSNYRALLERDVSGAELIELINALTTNKTSFFREMHHFDFLTREVFPSCTGRTVRIWSTACSTGEEPHSIAICAQEAGASVDILASDIDTNVLASAKAGVYRGELVNDLPSGMLRKYFQRGEGNNQGLLRVRAEVQRPIRFERINLIAGSWPRLTSFDVIFCRNVVIYFDRGTQEVLFRRLAQYLKPGGAMILGHSETLCWLPELYTAVGQTIYRRNGGSPNATPQATPSVAANRHLNGGQWPSSPCRIVHINPGEGHTARDGAEVRTTVLSNVAACLYDRELGVGGMCNFALRGPPNDRDQIERNGVTMIERLVTELNELGAENTRLRAKVFGGACEPPANNSDAGRKNAEFIRAYLTSRRIPLEAEWLGGSRPLEVRFATDTGKARAHAIESADRANEVHRAELTTLQCQPQGNFE